MNSEMKVIKRNGQEEDVSFDKVIWRMKNLCSMSPKIKNIDIIKIAQKVCSSIYNGVLTSELDELAAQLCTSSITKHPEFGELASRLIISNNHKLTSPSFSETIFILYNNKDKHGINNPLISKELFDIVISNRDKLNSYIDYDRDFSFDYFGFKTLEKAYLMKVNKKIVERIQHMIMRVALGIHGENIKLALETYDFMSQKYFTHATPTLFHSGTGRPQLLSCFLIGISDSVDGIYKSITDCAKISKWAGGVGVWAHNIRSSGSIIRSTNGKSNGLVPMLRVFNDTARHINQSGKRNGSFAFYLEPWHADILDYLEAKKNHGDENARARDLFYALWIPDLFMERVEHNEMWSLMCPDKCRGLSDVHGEEFNELYKKYENMDPSKNYVKKRIPARKVWEEILISQIETGTPYMLYKDACNRKSNQQNLGTIKSSNLCTEIIEYSDSEQYACCTLASIGLPKFLVNYDFSRVKKIYMYGRDNCKFCRYSKNYLTNLGLDFVIKDVEDQEILEELKNRLGDFETVPQIFATIDDHVEHIGGFDQLVTYFKPSFDFNKLRQICHTITRNLDKVVDINFYPVPETRYSNKLHRPLGIGVQGLADVFCRMKIPFDSDEAKLLNRQIFATIYYSSMETSIELSKLRRDPMKKIRELREKYNCGKSRFTKANEFTMKDGKTIWARGDKSDISKPENLGELENRYLPLDEELFRDNDQYLGSYSSFEGSPLSKGLFQFDLWGVKPVIDVPGLKLNWDRLREDVMEYGARNSLLLAPMPTASTSQILGNNECIEPITSNIYSRGTIAGTFIVVNKYLLNDLININIWNDELKNSIIKNGGSVNNIDVVPKIIKDIYKTSWDLSQKSLIDQCADRGAYVCQSQSMNLWLEDPDFAKLSSMHLYCWKKGLKTGLYYLRTKAAAKAQQFTISPDQGCEMCSA